MEFPAEEDDSEYGDPVHRPTERELLAAQALLQLHGSQNLNWRWAAKRKRTGLRSRGPIGPTPAPAAPDEPCPSKPWPDASSPDTPLIVCYSGGSSDPKSGAAGTAAVTKTKSVKKRREELRLAESVAQGEKEGLRGDIEMVRREIEWQKSLNMELIRAHKLVVPSQGKEKGQCEKVNTRLTLGLHSSPDPAVLHPHFAVLDASQPLIPNPTAAAEADKICKPSLRPGLNLSLGPSPVPDLNLPVEENGTAHLRLHDHVIVDSRFLIRAAAAAARQQRYRINKAKLRR